MKLGDFGVTLGGLSGKKKENFGHGKPFVPYMNVFRNSHIDKSLVDLVEIRQGEKQNRLQLGDYLFTTSSETPNEVGMSSVVNTELGEVYLNSFCFVFRPKNKSLDPNFGGYLFRGPLFRREIVTHAKGSTRFNLSKRDFLGVEIVFPESEREQKKIAEILGTVDEEIQKTDEVISTAEKLKRGLMQQLFTRGIGHTKFKKTRAGVAPQEWHIAYLGDLIILMKSGLSRRLSNVDIGLPVIRSENITKNNKLDLSNLKYWYAKDPQGADTDNYVLDDGDILVNFINSLAQIGKNCLFKTDGGKYIYTTNILRLKLDTSKILHDYFINFMQTAAYWNHIKSITKPAVNQASFTTIDFKKLDIPLPPIREQQEMIKVFSSVDEKIVINQRLKSKLALLKKGLMQDLLSGKVRVTKSSL